MATNSVEQRPDYLTLSFKIVDNVPLYIDIYPPSTDSSAIDSEQSRQVPTVVFFHGGGLTVGNRQAWLPIWLQKRVSNAGFFFISADYRLLPPATGHDILQDIKDLFKFLHRDLNSRLDLLGGVNFRINSEAIGVAGASAGGTCAYLSAIHADPKPKAIISIYAPGGNFLTPQYLTPKFKPFLRGREILDPASFSTFVYPFTPPPGTVADSPLSYDPLTNMPTNPRMFLGRLYLQLGLYLDYYTGAHEPSLSVALREAMQSGADSETLMSLIPERHRILFPQFTVTSTFPPTFLVHGSTDTAVPVEETHDMHTLLEQVGVPVKLAVAEGMEHSFDLEKDAEDLHGTTIFDAVDAFIRRHLGA